MDLIGSPELSETGLPPFVFQDSHDPFFSQQQTNVSTAEQMSEKARGKQPEHAFSHSSGSPAQPVTEKARGKLPEGYHSSSGSKSSSGSTGPPKMNLYAHQLRANLYPSPNETTREKLMPTPASLAWASRGMVTRPSTTNDGSKSVFNMEKSQERDGTVLPTMNEPQSSHPAQADLAPGTSSMSPVSPSGRPKHIPIVIDPNKYLKSPPKPERRLYTPIVVEGFPAPNLRFDHAKEMKEMAEAAERVADISEEKSTQDPTTPRSAGSSFYNFIRRPFKGTLPKTPTTPAKTWSPFDDNSPQPPSKSTWVEGQKDNGEERAARKDFFKAKVGDPSSTTIVSSSQASGTIDRTAYPVETYPWPIVSRDRSRSRPRVTEDTFAKPVSHNASHEGMPSRTNELAEGPPPVPPLPSAYRATRPFNLALDLATCPPTEAIEAAAPSGTMSRLRRQKSEEPSRAAGEISLRGAFKFGPKKSSDQK
jgi:hypothetical protein